MKCYQCLKTGEHDIDCPDQGFHAKVRPLLAPWEVRPCAAEKDDVAPTFEFPRVDEMELSRSKKNAT